MLQVTIPSTSTPPFCVTVVLCRPAPATIQWHLVLISAQLQGSRCHAPLHPLWRNSPSNLHSRPWRDGGCEIKGGPVNAASLWGRRARLERSVESSRAGRPRWAAWTGCDSIISQFRLKVQLLLQEVRHLYINIQQFIMNERKLRVE